VNHSVLCTLLKSSSHSHARSSSSLCLWFATWLHKCFQRFLNTLESADRNDRNNFFRIAVLILFRQLTIGVLGHMNTKMILAALALTLSLAGCAKKEEPAEAAQDAAASAGEAAHDASAAAGDAAAASSDAAAASSDAAAAATPPADAAAAPAPAPAEAPKP
jgi:uncharacterized membrane protein